MATSGHWAPFVVNGNAANTRTHARTINGNDCKCSQPSDKNMWLRLVSLSTWLDHVFFVCAVIVMTSVGEKSCFFSSPEPKAHGELIVYQSIRRPSVRGSVRA